MAQVSKAREGVWRVRWRYGGTRDGQGQSATRGSKREAEALARAIESRGHLARSADPEVRDNSIVTGVRTAASSGPTFREAAAALMVTKGACRKPTRDEYQRILDQHLIPRWGSRPVADISADDLTLLIADYGIVKNGVGSQLWAMARMVLRLAQARGMRPDNPSMGMRLPPRGESPATFLSPEERVLILDAASKHRTASREWPVFVRVGLEAGLRSSEVSGLQVRDLDLRNPERPLLHIRRAWRVSGDLKRDGGEVEKITPLKSETSLRTITIDPSLAEALKRVTRGKGPTAHIFTSRDGKPVGRKTVEDRWQVTVKRAQKAGLGCRPRFHDLRHTHASYLLEELGLTLEYVSKRLGHSDIAITYRYYVHLTHRSDDAFLAAVRADNERRAVAARSHLHAV